MKKRILATVMALTLGSAMLTACGSKDDVSTVEPVEASSVVEESSNVETTIVEESTDAADTEAATDETATDAATDEADTEAATDTADTEAATDTADTEAATDEADTETATTEAANSSIFGYEKSDCLNSFH